MMMIGVRKAPAMIRTIFTIGHSTRTIPDFIALLRQVEVDLLVDVRSIPWSRMTPQFNLDTLPISLAAEDIGYEHLRELGGRRHHPKSAPPSTNTFWRVLAFRNYADYAETDAFRAGFAELLALARTHRCAIMCAEAVWWRCHRRIITDYLLAYGVHVEHIMALGTVTPANLTPGAHVLSDGTGSRRDALGRRLGRPAFATLAQSVVTMRRLSCAHFEQTGASLQSMSFCLRVTCSFRNPTVIGKCLVA